MLVTFTSYTDPVSVFKKIIEDIIDDPGFKLEAKAASNALIDAVKLHQWCEESNKLNNYMLLHDFVRSLAYELDGCMSLKSQVQRSNREKMWEAFHKLQTNPAFIQRWQRFLVASIGSESTPILYQNVNDRLFRLLLKENLLVISDENTGEGTKEYTPTLCYEEQNALRYAAGYIPRALKDKISRSHDPNKELLLCSTELAEDDDESPHESKDWEKTVDRGGLFHVNHNVLSMEIQILKQVHRIECGKISADFSLRESVVPLITADDDVQFYWSLISAGWEPDVDKKFYRW